MFLVSCGAGMGQVMVVSKGVVSQKPICYLFHSHQYIPPMNAFAKLIASGFLIDRLVAFSKQYFAHPRLS